MTAVFTIFSSNRNDHTDFGPSISEVSSGSVCREISTRDSLHKNMKHTIAFKYETHNPQRNRLCNVKAGQNVMNQAPHLSSLSSSSLLTFCFQKKLKIILIFTKRKPKQTLKSSHFALEKREKTPHFPLWKTTIKARSSLICLVSIVDYNKPDN